MILKTKRKEKEINLMEVMDVNEDEIEEITLSKEEAKVAIFKLTFSEKLKKFLIREDLYNEFVENGIKIVHDFYKDEDEEIEKRVVITVIPPFHYNNGYILARYEEKDEYNEEFKICYNPYDLELHPYYLINQHYVFTFSTFGECETVIKKLIKNPDGVETICNNYFLQKDIYTFIEEVEKIIYFDIIEYYKTDLDVEVKMKNKTNNEILIKKTNNVFNLYYQSTKNERLMIQITQDNYDLNKIEIKIGLDKEGNKYSFSFYNEIKKIIQNYL